MQALRSLNLYDSSDVCELQVLPLSQPGMTASLAAYARVPTSGHVALIKRLNPVKKVFCTPSVSGSEGCCVRASSCQE